MINKNESDLEKGVEILHSEIRIPQSNALRILLLEDSPTDAELNEHLLHKAGINFTSLRVETSAAFVAALDTFRPDIILADYNLPGFGGMAALQIVRHNHPEVPVIMVTGALSDIEAVELIHAGAKDYMLKDRPARLAAAVQRALSSEQGIRARKQAEEKFRKIAESAQDAIIMMGTDQCISFWNPAAERIFGYTAAEAMGQELHALITPAAAHTKFTQAFHHFQESGEGPIVGKVRELTALRKGGEEFPVELSVSATQFGGQWHAVGIVRDITERKQAEAKINEQIDELRRWYEATLGREMRTLELKREINELLAQAGQPPRYLSVAS
ncbi:MAG: PAS domain S-box protein [Nitrosomonadales bacterium]|nr:PAS domain S-box protein [Nitrosomonadales bacterium]